MATGTIERIVSHTESEQFDFDPLFDREAEEGEWSEDEYAAAARMGEITVYRSGTAEECEIFFLVDGREYAVKGSFILEGSGALSYVLLEPMAIITERGDGMQEALPDALLTLLTPALKAIAGEAW